MHTDGRTDRYGHDEALVALRNFANAHKSLFSFAQNRATIPQLSNLILSVRSVCWICYTLIRNFAASFTCWHAKIAFCINYCWMCTEFVCARLDYSCYWSHFGFQFRCTCVWTWTRDIVSCKIIQLTFQIFILCWNLVFTLRSCICVHKATTKGVAHPQQTAKQRRTTVNQKQLKKVQLIPNTAKRWTVNERSNTSRCQKLR